MKKFLHIQAMLLLAAASALSAQASGSISEYTCDFNNGIPEEIALFDLDDLEPSQDVKTYGFEQGTPWVSVKLADSHFTVAASTSWYRNPGQSSDWMVLPKIRIENADIRLQWAARAHDSKLSDGYSVYVSDIGGNPADFDTAKPLVTVSAENADWTTHSLSLAEFEGKEIYIAFVNNSTDKALLYLDDIEVGVDKTLTADRLLPGLLLTEEPLKLQGVIRNTGAETLRAISVELSIDGRDFRLSVPQADLAAGAEQAVELTTDFCVSSPGVYPYTLSVKGGGEAIERKGELYVTRRNILVEEGKGTWCGFCPRGTVAMKNMSEKYPDQFIGVAVHVGKDPMALPGYSVTGSSYPVCIVNRLDKFQGDPARMEEFFLEARKSRPKAAIFGNASYAPESNEISISSSVVFDATQDDSAFGICYILKENDVHVAHPDYNQKNSYSYGDVVMGGYENLSDPVPASQMWYQEVARFQARGHEGLERSIPAYITGGEPISNDYTFRVPDNVLDISKTQLVGLVVDSRDGEVLNASVIPIAGTSAIVGITDDNEIRIAWTGDTLEVIADSAVEEIVVCTIDGMTLAHAEHCEALSVSEAPKGLYIIRVKANNKYHYFKQLH